MPELVVDYELRGAARAAWHSRAGEVLLSGPAGTGKSLGALLKLHISMLQHPGAKALILRKTMVSLGPSALATFRKHIIAEAIDTGFIRWYGGSTERPPAYLYANGSEINIGGMDEPKKVMSTEYDIIYVQEAIELTRDDWEYAKSRLRNGVMPYQQLLADTNPERPTHWLKQRCDEGVCLLLESRHEDNPLYFTKTGEMTTPGHDYIEGILDTLTGVRYLRLRRGLWVAAEGLVYREWDPAVHVIPRFPVPLEWPRLWGVDFGFTNPFVCGMWATDPDGRLIRYREIYHTGRTVTDHARAIMQTVSRETPGYEGEREFAYQGREWIEPKPRYIVCDHDAGDREVLAREIGIGTLAADKRVETGLQTVQKRLAIAGDGKPRLYVMEGCVVERDTSLVAAGRPVGLAEEMPGYVWDKGPRTVQADGKTPPEVPLKRDDHAADEMRYVVMQEDRGARPRIRFM